MLFVYSPLTKSVNRSRERFVSCLEAYGKVEPLPAPREFFRNPLKYTRRYDAVFFNWLDSNLVNSEGALTLTGLLKFFLGIAYGYVIARRTVFVRHNVYPHACNDTNGKRAERIINFSERFFSASVTHSGHNVTSHRHYFPHALLHSQNDPLPEPESYFVIFGVIQPYKGILEFVRALPPDRCVWIVGPCGNKDYLDQIVKASSAKSIVVRAEFVDEKEANLVVAKSRGLLLTQHGKDMIVSGSYFYAAGLGVPVYAIESPFLCWAREELGQPGIHLAKSISGLCDILGQGDCESRDVIRAAAFRNFGDETRHFWMQRLLTKLRLNA